MTLGLSGAAIAGIAVAAGGAYSSYAKGKAASKAADAQIGADQNAMNENNYRFSEIEKLLSPYANKGEQAVNKQGDFLGLNGAAPQKQIVNEVEQSPYFQSMQQQGSNAILQNASATGGLRGGNTEGALAQFQPQLLQQVLDQYYTKLGGLTSVGENAAAMTGNAGLQTGASNAKLLEDQGAASAGEFLAQGKTQAGYANAITSGLGQFQGLGGKF